MPLVHVKVIINSIGLELADLSLVQHTILVILTQEACGLLEKEEQLKYKMWHHCIRRQIRPFSLSPVSALSVWISFQGGQSPGSKCTNPYVKSATAFFPERQIPCFSWSFVAFPCIFFLDSKLIFILVQIFPLVSMWSVSLKTKLFWSLSVSWTIHNYFLPLWIFTLIFVKHLVVF